MYTLTKMQIIEIIKKNGQAQVKELVRELGVTQAAIHRALNKLIATKTIIKKGTPPKVFYFLADNSNNTVKLDVSDPHLNILKKNYIYISPTGEILEGLDGFLYPMPTLKII